MTRPPETVWIHEGFWESGDYCYWTRDEKETAEETQYVRADIVDELVTALKTAHCWTSREIHTQHTAPLIEGALSKLEKS